MFRFGDFIQLLLSGRWDALTCESDCNAGTFGARTAARPIRFHSRVRPVVRGRNQFDEIGPAGGSCGTNEFVRRRTELNNLDFALTRRRRRVRRFMNSTKTTRSEVIAAVDGLRNLNEYAMDLQRKKANRINFFNYFRFFWA